MPHPRHVYATGGAPVTAPQEERSVDTKDYWRESRKHRREVRESWWECLCGRKNPPGDKCFTCGRDDPYRKESPGDPARP